MKLRLRILLPVVVFGFVSNVASGVIESEKRIAELGTMVITAVSPSNKGTVTIHTARVGASSDCANDWLRQAIQEYGAKEVTMIQGLEISLGNAKLFVPPSSYLSIFDAKRASLRFEKGSFVLEIYAGDGADAEFDLIYFDKTGVNRSMSYSYLSPNQPSEDTRYHHIAIK